MEIKKSQKADLENKKGLFFEGGLIIAILAVFLAFNWSSKGEEEQVMTETKAAVEEEMVPITEPEQPKPQEVAPVPVVSDEIQIVEDNVKIDDAIDFTSEDDKKFAVQEVAYVEKKEAPKEEEVEEDIPFALVEEQPKFQGGDQNTFRTWVMKQVQYPESAAENGVSGKVLVQFVVDKDGSVKNVQVLRKVDPALDKEAVRVISSSPKWTPGKQRNKNVRVVFQFPVVFQLQ